MSIAMTLVICLAIIGFGKLLFDRGYEAFGGTLFGLAGFVLVLVGWVVILTP